MAGATVAVFVQTIGSGSYHMSAHSTSGAMSLILMRSQELDGEVLFPGRGLSTVMRHRLIDQVELLLRPDSHDIARQANLCRPTASAQAESYFLLLFLQAFAVWQDSPNHSSNPSHLFAQLLYD